MSLRSRMRYMNPYDIHKALINDYVLKRPGDSRFLQRDTSKDKRDVDVLKEHHRFLWDDEDKPLSWEEQFAKKYYDKLFKEYCIADLALYKDNKIALRWRTEQEVLSGKGQFVCGNKRCSREEDLRTWEVNFAYVEDGVKKNVLVKIRLCPDCSKKLNHHSKKREVKRLKRTPKKRSSSSKPRNEDTSSEGGTEPSSSTSEIGEAESANKQGNLWENVQTVDVKSREEEMEEYLQDLLFS